MPRGLSLLYGLPLWIGLLRHDPRSRLPRAAAALSFVCPAAAILALVCACASPDPEQLPAFDVHVVVHGDPEQPVAKAQLLHGGRVVGITDENGWAGLRIRGLEGQSVGLGVKCPKGFASPAEPMVVALRRIGERLKRPRCQVRCPPTLRRVVVAVRAEQGAGLPVRYLGKELARTDRSGAAHVTLQLPPGQQFELTLDTSQNPELRPQSPTAAFEVEHRDAIFLFDQVFTRKPNPRPRTRRPKGPTRI